MRRVLGGVCWGWVVAGCSCASVFADGGSVCLSVKKGGYQVTVFNSPTPFRAGPVDVSVLVQDSLTSAPMPEARVTVRMTKLGQPALEFPATREVATNKLFRAAQFELPEPGRWQLEVQVEGVHGSAVIDGELEAAGPLPRWRETWASIAWPALAIAVFGIHQMLVRRRVNAANRGRRCADCSPPIRA
jgi:hypothetical protein